MYSSEFSDFEKLGVIACRQSFLVINGMILRRERDLLESMGLRKTQAAVATVVCQLAVGLAGVEFDLQLIVAFDERFKGRLNLGDTELKFLNLRGRGVESTGEPCQALRIRI